MNRPDIEQRLLDLHWLEFKCDSNDVPAYGVVEVTEFEAVTTGGVRLLVQRPTTRDEDQYPKFINGRTKIIQGDPGRCTRSGLLVARMRKPTSGGDLARGDWFVAEDDEFLLKRTVVPSFDSAFVYLGGYQQKESATIGIGIFEYKPVHAFVFYGELTEDLDAPATFDAAATEATCKLLAYDFDDGSLSDSGETFTCANRLPELELDSGKMVGCIRARGENVIVFGECP